MKIILFDIDGTLLSSGGAGTKALEMAFHDAYFIENALEGYSLAGKTDPLIIKEMLRRHNKPSDDGIIPKLLSDYIGHLKEEIKNPKKHLMPGIKELLEVLDGLKQYSLGLLTGNIEQGARVKLESFGIWGHFSYGAYGSDHHDRNMLIPFALDRYKALTGETVKGKDCVIVGDTPRDVECAKPYGAYVIGVATGPFSSSELNEAGADYVVEDLSDMDEIISILG